MKLDKALLASITLASSTLFAAPAMAADDKDAIWSAIKSLEEKVEMTADAMDSDSAGKHGHGTSSGKTTIGGYGEMHYNNLDSKKEVDFHRSVLFLGHEFSNKTRFFMEWDLEHAGTMELEQSFLEFDISDKTSVKTGVVLIPVGIINETHEPPTFYGVERNPVENKIIPTTWREGGVGISGELAEGWSYDAYLTSGLETSSGDGYAVRDGRQHVIKAVAEDLAYTGRIKWVGMPGVEIAATYQRQGDMTQGADATAGAASLIETHAVITRGATTLKALYAAWDLDGSGPESNGSNEQNGWYIEPSYKVTPKFGIFARYNEWDNTAGSATDSKYKQTDVGANYWPEENVVVKLDIMDQGGKGTDSGFNLGVGFQF